MEADSAFITDRGSRADRAERQAGVRRQQRETCTHSFYHTRSEKVFLGARIPVRAMYVVAVRTRRDTPLVQCQCS